MAGKRHSSEEITAKLRQAADMAAKGKTQAEIARALGISVMTYHRWRKGEAATAPAAVAPAPAPREVEPALGAQGTDLSALERENTDLRRIVADLLLEKLKLEDELRVCTSMRRPRQA